MLQVFLLAEVGLVTSVTDVITMATSIVCKHVVQSLGS